MRRRLALAVAITVALLAAALSGLLLTTPGLNFTLRLAAPFLDDALSFERAEGRLAGPVVLHGVSWHAGSYRGTAQRIEIDWELPPLLNRRVVVHHLEASGVTAQPSPTPGPESGEPAQWPDSITLPVSVDVGRAAFSNIELTVRADAQPLVVDSLAFRVITTEQTTAIEQIAISGEHVGLDGSLRFTAGDEYSAATVLDWWLALPDAPRVSGHTEARFTKRAIEIEQALVEPAIASITGSADFSTGQPQWQALLSLPQADLSAVQADWPAVRLASDLQATGSGAQGELNGNLALPDYLPTAINLAGTFAVKDGRLQIERLALALANREERLEARGYLQLNADLPAANELQLDWHNLQWPLQAEPVLVSNRGSLQLAGTPERYTFSAEAAVDGNAVPASLLTMAGTGNTQALDIPQLRGELLEGVVEGMAQLRLAPAFSAALSLQARGLNPGAEFQDWNGNIAFDTAVNAASDNFAATVTKLNGTLRGYPWRGSGEVKFDGKQWSVNRVALMGDGAQLKVSGTAGNLLDLNWELAADDLQVLHPKGTGTVSSSGSLSGTKSRPVLDASLTGTSLGWDSYSVRSVTLETTVDITDASESSVDLKATQLQALGTVFDSLAINASGQASSHAVVFALETDQGTANAQLNGGWLGNSWQGEVAELVLKPLRESAWSLANPVPLLLDRTSAAMNTLCIASDSERVCAEAQWSQEAGVQASSKLTDLQMARLAPLIPGAPDLSGLLSADISFSGADLASATGSLTARLRDGLLQESLGDDDQALIEDATGELEIRLAQQRVNAVGALQLGDKGSVDFSIDVPIDQGAAPGDLPVSGTLNASTQSLALLPLFSRDLDNVIGQLRADLELTGTVSTPIFAGDLNLSEARADIPQFGVSLTDINVAMTARERGMAVNGTFASGDGNASFNGQLDFAGATPTGTLALSGKRLTIVDLPQIRINASPDVNVAIKGRAMTFSGSVRVPSARIAPLAVGDAVRVSPDQVIVSAEEAPDDTAARFLTTTEVELVLGNDVTIDAYGLTGDIEGRLAIFDSPNALTTGTGELVVVDGKYEAWGQKLDVERGRLIFSGGELSNPAMDVSAQRKIEAITVGVNIRGNLRTPELAVFSDPQMSSTEAFSYLLTGRSLSNASDSERQYLDTASNALALRGGALLASQLGRQLGLNDVALEGADNREETRFVIGTYLSPNLYVSFGLGLFEAVNALRIRYQVNQNWSLAVESGTESSTDIEYTLER